MLFALALAGSADLSPAQVRLPTIGDAAAEDLPVGVERRYGDQIMREVWRDPAYLDDPVLGDYLNALWQPMLAAARKRGDIDDDIWAQFAWKAFLVRDRSVNAFALPGGFVGVHLGLIAMTASEDELASVLAHELSHVSQRHIARSIGSANRQGTASMVAMLLGVLAASRAGNADMAQAAIVGSQAAAVQGQLNFSRDMEREADRIGFGIFSEAGFGAAGMAGMFGMPAPSPPRPGGKPPPAAIRALMSMFASFFICENCLKPGILPMRPVEAPSCTIIWRICANFCSRSLTSCSLRPEPRDTRFTRP